MRCQSVSTTNTDGYRAGCEIAEALQESAPEVILLFMSTSYMASFSDLFAGIQDTLDRDDLIIFGGTGDGIYETARVAHHGVAALGLNSEGSVRWVTAVESGVATDSFGAAQRCAQRALDEVGEHADFAFVMADGIQADGTLIAAGVSSVLPSPFFGGLAGDDRKFSHTCVSLDGDVYENAVAVLLGCGDIVQAVNAASGWTPIGAPGLIDDCEGSQVRRIDGKTAQEFMRAQLGKAPGEVDLGIVPLATYDDPSNPNFSLRALSRFDEETGAINLFGSITCGQQVRVCNATREEVIAGVEQALAALRDTGLEPAAAIVVSCAGRKWLLEDRCHEEVDRVFAAIGEKIPLIGFPSFGEIGPFRKPDGSYSPVYFHNSTYVICLIGK